MNAKNDVLESMLSIGALQKERFYSSSLNWEPLRAKLQDCHCDEQRRLDLWLITSLIKSLGCNFRTQRYWWGALFAL